MSHYKESHFTHDAQYLWRCLQLAQRGLYGALPNPFVGALFVKDDRIISEGWHALCGGPHAERAAVAACHAQYGSTDLLRGSTAYVSLEPCCFTGRTPPCTDILKEVGISRLVAAITDPHPKVAGKGISILEQAGVATAVGRLQPLATFVNRRFITAHQQQRPYVILKWAQSSDGFVDDDTSERRLISNSTAHQLSHHWRATECGILVGTGTALHDNPSLTTRLVSGPNPTRIVLDRRGILPPTAKVFSPDSPTIVVVDQARAGAYRSPADHVTPVFLDFTSELPESKGNAASNPHYLRIDQLCHALYSRNIHSLIVEGGPTLHRSFIWSGLWDEARVITAPMVLGNGIPAASLPTTSSLRFSRLLHVNDQVATAPTCMPDLPLPSDSSEAIEILMARELGFAVTQPDHDKPGERLTVYTI